MHIKGKIALLVVMVLALLPAAGNAYACSGSGTHSGISFTSDRHEGSRGEFGVLRVTATYLGMSPWALKHELAGSSLANIANATPGKSASGLVDALAAALKTRLDAWVAAGKLSSTREATILTNATTKITAIVNMTWPSHHGDNDQDDD